MDSQRLASWQGLPTGEIFNVFPDAVRLGEMSVDFGSVDMQVYRFSDAAGNTAFAFDRGNGLTSHGSQILGSNTLARLKSAGAVVSGL